MAKLAYAYRVLGIEALRSPKELRSCRKRTLARQAALAADDKADISLLRAKCRACGACEMASI